MEEILREIEQSEKLRAFLRSRIPVGDGPGCRPNCSLILEDLERNGRLTGYPPDSMGAPTYPAEGKVLHLALELGVEMKIDGIRVRAVKDLLPFIQDKLEKVKVKS